MNKKGFIRAVCALGATLMISTSANATPTFFVGTGHYYEHISTVTSWSNARTTALGMSHLGQQGYLANITSVAENDFLGTLASIGWIGGTDNDTDSSEGVWIWADGPEAGVNFWNGLAGGSSPTFAAWHPNEPNNVGGVGSGEDFAHYSNGIWNDHFCPDCISGYFVEYDEYVGQPANTQVPEPGTLALFGLGLAGLGYMRRKGAAQKEL